MLRSFNSPVKHRVRAEYRTFLKETVLRHKKAQDVKVLCLPGHEAVEIFDVYDRLGILRKNIYGVEWNEEAFKRLKAQNLGIHLWKGDVFEYLGTQGMFELINTHKDVTVLLKRDDVNKVSFAPVEILPFKDRGETYFSFDVDIRGIPNKPPELPDDSWIMPRFDIIALDICGHVTGKVVNALSTIFRAGLLNDRGVFTLTTLAMREHPLTHMLIRMALMMDAMIRGTMWEAAHDIRPNMVKSPYDTWEERDEAVRERMGFDALIVLLAFGNELFIELLKLYRLTDEGKLLTARPQNNIFDKILMAQFDETAMIVREIRRYSYRSEQSHMRTTMVYFRKAARAIRETDSMMEVIHHLGHWLGAPIIKIETPKVPVDRQAVIAKLRQSEYTEA